MCPNENGPPTFEERLAALEQQVALLQENLEKNNLNITSTLNVLTDALEEARDKHCELPPFCET